MKIKHFILLTTVVLAFGSCKKFNSNYDALLNDPNNPSVGAATPDLYLNGIQLNFKDFYQQAQDFSAQVTRMQHFYGPTYENGFSSQSFDGIWDNAYANILKNVNAMIPVAVHKQQYMHVAIGQILSAYTLFTLVDMFANVPYSEALQGQNNLNPKLDSGRLVYPVALTMLDSAISNLAKTSVGTPLNDLFYANSDASMESASWRKLAKTLKLRAYVQMRRAPGANVTSQINALILEDDLIDNSSQDFVFKFSKQSTNPDSRNPYFTNNYTAAGINGANDYMSNFYMYEFADGGTEGYPYDPRTRYYFYRQTDNIFSSIIDPTTLQFTLPCNYRQPPPPDAQGNPYNPYCTVDNGSVSGTGNDVPGQGYIGRDFGNNEGIPPDKTYRTTFGIYPAGGRVDEDQAQVTITPSSKSAEGAGIYPIFMSSFTDFLRSEAALTLGTTGDPRAYLLSGVTKSITTVMAYPGTVGVVVDSAFLPTQAQIDSYVSTVGLLYDNLGTDEETHLEVIMGQYYRAAWGNGLEAYNFYRRTGHPSLLQPLLIANTGHYIRSFYYPSAYIDRHNSNPPVLQKPTDTKVFWDILPDYIFDK